jgi:O-antigen/teichoic acid export membrane protein
MFKLNYFLKDTFLYIAGDILNKLSIFLLIPIYTSVFTVAEYGILEQIVIATTFFHILISFSSKTAFLRLFFNYSEYDIKRFLFTIISFITVVFFLFLIILTLLDSILISNHYKDYIKFTYFILFYVYFLSLNELSLVLLRVKKEIFKYSIFTLFKTILELSSVIIFIKYLEYGVIGKLEGSLLAIIILFFIIAKSFLLKNLEFKLELSFFKDYTSYSYPIVIHSFLGWFLVSYDKFLLNKNFDVSDLGLFALGLQIIMIFKYISESALKSFNVEIFSKPKIIEKHAYNIIVLILSILILFSLFFSFFSKEMILLLANENYIESESIVRYLIISRVVMIYNFILVMILYLYNDTKSVTSSTYIGLAITMIVSTLLIPNFYFIGAAISATIVYAVIGYFLTKKVLLYINFELDIKLLALALLLIFSTYLSSLDLSYYMKSIIILSYILMLYFFNNKFIYKIYKKGLS